MASKTDKLLTFIKYALDNDQRDKLDAPVMAKGAGMDVHTLRASIVRLRRQGVLEHEPRDYTTIRLLPGAGVPPTKVDPKPTKMAPAREPHTKASKAEPVVEPKVVETPAPAPALTAPTATGSLVGARAVIYDDSEIAKLEGRVVAAEENAKFLRAQLEDIRAMKPLDAEAALLIGVVAKLQAFPKPEAP